MKTHTKPCQSKLSTEDIKQGQTSPKDQRALKNAQMP